MGNKLSDLYEARTATQVIGCLLVNPELLAEPNYNIEDFDFFNDFHRLIYATIFNLFSQGVTNINYITIDNFISQYEKQYKMFNENNGMDWIEDVKSMAEINNFDYYYYRLKKFSLLRYYEDICGKDTTDIYNTTLVSPEEQAKEQDKFDRASVEDIIDYMESIFVEETKIKFSSKSMSRGQLAAKGMRELKERLKEAPEYGLPLQSPILNTIVRGARLGKLYLRSGGTGSGKTRLSMGDILNWSVPWFYDTEKKQWTYTGFSEPVLFISTELEEDELQTLIISYVSGVNESHILDGEYEQGEEERVDKAIEYIESSPLYIEILHDFNIQQVERMIKKYKREKQIQHFHFDYVHMSASLIVEISSISKGMKLREDQILFLFIDRIKNLCNSLRIHFSTGTQLNGDYLDNKDKDERLLRGEEILRPKNPYPLYQVGLNILFQLTVKPKSVMIW